MPSLCGFPGQSGTEKRCAQIEFAAAVTRRTVIRGQCFKSFCGIVWPVLLLAGLFALPLRAQQFASNAGDGLEARPNRPSSSDSAAVLSRGVLQWEYGWTRESGFGGSNSSDLGGELRYGVTDRFEIRWGGTTFIRQFEGAQSNSGFGDQYLKGQLELRKETPRTPAIAASYAIKFPSANAQLGLGSGRVDHTVALLLSKSFRGFSMDFNEVTQFAGRPEETGFDRGSEGIVALSHSIAGPVSAIGEVSAQSRLNSLTPGYVTNLWAITYEVRRRVVLDCAIEVGVTPGAPRQRILVGLTYAVGEFGGHSAAMASTGRPAN